MFVCTCVRVCVCVFLCVGCKSGCVSELTSFCEEMFY